MDKALLQYEMNKKGITTSTICKKLDMWLHHEINAAYFSGRR